MPISQQQLGQRLKIAREACSLTQEQVSEDLGLSRSAITQIELGKRSVSSLELDRLARLYGRDIRDFLSEDFQEEGALIALFRANKDLAEEQETVDGLRHCMEIGSQLTNLERLIGLDRDLSSVVRYNLPVPKRRYEAIRHGVSVAQQERQRLGIGYAPIPDIAGFLEKQGVRTAVVCLPDEVSGLTLFDPQVGPFVAVNRNDHIVRRVFSFVHEYAHVLMDCHAKGMISRNSERTALLEVRANSFGASFLMPESGVRNFLSNLGKGRGGRLLAETPTDEQDAIAIEARSGSKVGDIHLHDVVLLAHHFGVSRTVAIYRLRNLQIIPPSDLERLLEQERSGQGRQLEKLLHLPEPDHMKERNRFRCHFLNLALDAFDSELISRSKLEELFATVREVPRSDVALELDDLIGGEEATEVSIPT
ncbi:XRE family transcriptional regulator [Acidobacteria bacterium AH-259-L09]|nr:XRE family transcriptional regulator [Acidobacteria bacterium AH-259-L09]